MSWTTNAVLVIGVIAMLLVSFSDVLVPKWSSASSVRVSSSPSAGAGAAKVVVVLFTDETNDLGASSPAASRGSSAAIEVEFNVSNNNNTSNDLLGAGNAFASETLAPETVATASTIDAILNDAKKHTTALPPDPCDLRSIERDILSLNEETGQWAYKTNTWCRNRVKFPVSGAEVQRHFANKKIVFMGDSVARNSFVLTMSRMCNEEHMFRCITRMPTFEYDVVNPPWNRGPLGCVPLNVSTSREATTPCYLNGRFVNVPLRGLTLKSVPQDRNGRRNFIRKGLIGPVMAMQFANVTLLYHSITKPFQLVKTGLWMAKHPNSFLHGDAIVVSIGPHLHIDEIRKTPTTLVQGLAAIRAVTNAPILAAEFVHAIGTVKPYNDYVDGLMEQLRQLYAPLGVTMVPQRFITRHGFVLRSGNVSLSDRGKQRGCGYYDAQHPALRCQMLTSEMLLGTAIAKLAPA